jgi:sugar phosphate isomerase/epimerase
MPFTTPFRFFVPMLREHAGYLTWIQTNGVGVEIQDLLHPTWDPSAEPPLDEIGRFWRKTLSGLEIPVCFHGPEVAEFSGTPSGTGPREEVLRGLLRAMDCAVSIGARSFVAHPRLGKRGEDSPSSRDFWKTAADHADGLGLDLLLENTDEDDPRSLLLLLEANPSPALGLCLDLGHVHQSSSKGIMDWLEAWDSELKYVHFYNSSGGPIHRALGDGLLDLESFIDRLGLTRPGLPVCLEMDVPQILGSIAWLTSRGLFKLKQIEARDLF